MSNPDAVRAALAELVECHTEEAGLTMSMVANRADFDAFMERCDQRLAAALDAARAALSEPVPGDVAQWLASVDADGYRTDEERFAARILLRIATTPQEPTP